ALNGEAMVKGRTMFLGREGEQVAAPEFTLYDDPTNELAFGASTHDSEGLPTRKNALVLDGELVQFLHNTYTGRRTGMGSTGSAVRGGEAPAPRGGGRPRPVGGGERTPPAGLPAVGRPRSLPALHAPPPPATPPPPRPSS